MWSASAFRVLKVYEASITVRLYKHTDEDLQARASFRESDGAIIAYLDANSYVGRSKDNGVPISYVRKWGHGTN